MSDYNTRLGCTLSFDNEKEKDIIEVINQLKDNRKLGEFISYLLRVAMDNPELIDKRSDGSYKTGDTIKEMSKLGISPVRYKAIEDMKRSVNDMYDKINKMYDMCLKVYTLAQFGKQLNISNRSDNLLMGTFIAEQELSKICEIFGLKSINTIYSSNKQLKVHDFANDVLAYIIESYDSIINELKRSIFKEVELKTKPLEFDKIRLDVEPIKLSIDGVQLQDNSKGLIKSDQFIEDSDSDEEIKLTEDTEQIDDTSNEDDDAVVFDPTNLGMLTNFFGDADE